jgi:GNAT superfamily N-acetyltransferase
MTPPDAPAGRTVAARQFTRQGVPLTLRSLGPDDAARLQDFFYSHNFDTIQMRYGHAVTRMTSERAIDLVSVDQSRDVAIAIFETDDARQIIHAVGRYYLDPDGRSAEVAFVVRESKRRSGLGTLLLQTLVDVARARGLDTLWGRVRRDNLPMLALFRRFGGLPVASPDAGDSDLDMRIPLHPPTPPPAAERPRHRLVRLRKAVAKVRPPRPSAR